MNEFGAIPFKKAIMEAVENCKDLELLDLIYRLLKSASQDDRAQDGHRTK